MGIKQKIKWKNNSFNLKMEKSVDETFFFSGWQGDCGVSYEIQRFNRHCSCNFIPAGMVSSLSHI